MGHFASITPKFTADDKDFIFDAAIQGADYWTVVMRGVRNAEQQITAMYVSTIDDPENVTLVGEEDLERATAAILTGETKVSPHIREQVLSIFSGDSDDFNVDADGGDIILQIAALGEVVYG